MFQYEALIRGCLDCMAAHSARIGAEFTRRFYSIPWLKFFQTASKHVLGALHQQSYSVTLDDLFQSI